MTGRAQARSEPDPEPRKEAITLLNEYFERREDFDLRGFAARSFGVFQEEAAARAALSEADFDPSVWTRVVRSPGAAGRIFTAPRPVSLSDGLTTRMKRPLRSG